MRLQARKHLPQTHHHTMLWWWVCGLLLALAPTLGQMHRVLHGGHGVVASLTSAAAIHGPQHHRGGDDERLPQLFGTHSAADCLLLDQWTWAQPNIHLSTLPPLAPVAPVPAPPYWHSGSVQVAAFQARAPPIFWWG